MKWPEANTLLLRVHRFQNIGSREAASKEKDTEECSCNDIRKIIKGKLVHSHDPHDKQQARIRSQEAIKIGIPILHPVTLHHQGEA